MLSKVVCNSLSKLLFVVYCLSLTIGVKAQQPNLILPIGHDQVSLAEFSPNDKYIITAGFDNDVKIWDTKTGSLLQIVKGPLGGSYEHNVSQICLSPDNKSLIIVYHDGSLSDSDYLRIYNLETGKMTDFRKKSIYYTLFMSSGDLIVIYRKENVDTAVIEINKIDSLKPYYTESIIEKKEEWKSTWLLEFKYSSLVSLSDSDSVLQFSFKDSLLKFDISIRKILNKMENILVHKNVFGVNKNNEKIVFKKDSTLFIYTQKDKISNKINRHFFSSNLKVEFSPDEKQIYVSEGDKIFIINAESLVVTDSIMCGNVYFFRISHNGNYLFVRPSNWFDLESDNFLIWDLKNKKELYKIARANAPSTVQISQDNKFILISTQNYNAELWDLQTGKFLYSLKNVSDRNVMSVGYPIALFTKSGKYFVHYPGNSGVLNIIESKTGKIIAQCKGQYSKTERLIFSTDEKYLISKSNSEIIKWNFLTGKKIFELPTGWALRAAGKELAISSDNKYLAIGNEVNTRLVDFTTGHILRKFSDTSAHTIVVSFDFKPDSKEMAISFRKDSINLITFFNLEKKKNSDSFYISTPEEVYQLNYNNDGSLLATVSDKIRIYNTLNKRLYREYELPLDGTSPLLFSKDNRYLAASSWWTNRFIIWDIKADSIILFDEGHSIAFSSDNKNLVVVEGDKKIKIYSLVDFKMKYSAEKLNSDDYIIRDKDNHYDGSPGARKLLYFTCGTEIIELDQLKDQLWVPNLAERINKGEFINAKTLTELNICGLTPVVEDSSNVPGEYFFKINPQRGGIGETILFVNGIEALRFKPDQLRNNAGEYELIVKKEELKNYFVPGRINPVTVKAYTADNAISSRGVAINEDKTKETSMPPNLYAVMIGISDYKGDELDLKYAAKDAMDISATLANAAQKMLNTDGKEHVFMYNLTTGNDYYQLPEKNGIKKVLEDIGKKATANDILLVFFAGHGVMEGVEKKQFYFLTADASKATATSSIADVGISTSELTEWMKPQNIKAQKRILIFDACNSGQAIKDFVTLGISGQDYLAARNDDKAEQIKAIDKLNEKSGLFILSASASNQSAYEMGRYSQGLLTYALLKAIKQQPDILEGGKYLDVSRWFNAAEKTVSDLSKENGARQEPQIVSNTDFNIGIVDADVIARIMLPDEKPLFTASNFQNNDEAIADDNLDLNKLINLQLNDFASRGTDSKIVYVTATNSPDAYSLSGRYIIKGNSITVTVNIKHDKKIKTKFELKGTRDKLTELAGALTKKAIELAK